MSKQLEDLFTLTGRVVVITGATGLLGLRHCEAVACAGGIPVLLDLSKKDVEYQSDRLREVHSVDSSGYVVDITNESMVLENAELLCERYGKIDGLINNAANNPKVESADSPAFSRLENFPLDQWSADLAVGLTGAYLCAKHYGSSIARNVDGGSIINISSDLGLIAPDQRLYQVENRPLSEQPVKPITYSVVKSGLIGLTRYLSTYWTEKNVRCNALCPGGVENGQDVEFIDSVSARVPLGRMAQSTDYASTLIWMLSESSSYLNGAVIAVDGGRTAW